MKPISAQTRAGARDGRPTLSVAAGSESGITLIEVVVSSLIVGLIAIGTLTGFAGSNRASADERARNQATLLAAQDEENLRGRNITELDQLGTETHSPQTINGTTFTVTSSAEYVAAAQNKLTCEVTGGAANYLQTTSKVTWPALPSGVTQSSIVDVPTSLQLLVKTFNQNHEALPGVSVAVSNRAETVTNAEETTPASGCIVFGALPEKEVNVTAVAGSDVNEAEEPSTSAPAKEVTLSPTTLTGPIEFTLAPPGTIEPTFASNGVTTGVTGDTFFATHTGVSKALVGGSKGTYVAATAKLAGLFPFQTAGGPNPYKVYAGDCAANSPKTVAGIEEPSAQVEPNGTVKPTIEVPAFNLTVYKGATTSEGVLTTATSATIINTACSSTAHAVKITSAGLLEQKYQPYAKELQVCVVGLIGSTYYKSTQGGFTNTVKAGSSSQSFFLKKTGYQSSSSVLTC
ncbi:MAG TPA: type II secretion system protein [Solirubrobacteraceae bacterium]|nr:type II secretion system protein [Solirubrobacteraceae bacterium]